MAVEQASYKVLAKEGPFEIRLYEPMVVASCQEADLSGGDGFSRLFNYIGGNNRDSNKISMTAPVLNRPEARQATMAFVMPNRMRLQDLPRPNDPALELVEIQERRMAAVVFSGRVNPGVTGRKKAELLEWLRKNRRAAVGETELARYNPPFLPGFLRRNELLVEVSDL